MISAHTEGKLKPEMPFPSPIVGWPCQLTFKTGYVLVFIFQPSTLFCTGEKTFHKIIYQYIYRYHSAVCQQDIAVIKLGPDYKPIKVNVYFCDLITCSFALLEERNIHGPCTLRVRVSGFAACTGLFLAFERAGQQGLQITSLLFLRYQHALWRLFAAHTL